jgi:membrane-associated phospholipid phosphatase
LRDYGEIPTSRVSIAVGALAAVGFGLLVVSLGSLEWYDAAIAVFFERLRGCDTSRIVFHLSSFAGWITAAGVVIVVALAGGGDEQRQRTMRSIVWLGIALVLVQVLKLSLERARPGMPPGTMDGASFPSGHVANAVLCVGAALRIGAGLRGWRSLLRWIVLLGGVVLVAGIAFSRIYLGRHWATDVVGSILLGVWFWAMVDDVRRPVLGWRGGMILAGALIIPCCAIGLGERPELPSPTTLRSRVTLAWPLHRHERWLDEASQAGWVPGRTRRDTGFLRFTGTEMALGITTGTESGLVLKVVGRPLRKFRRGCRSVDLVVDGVAIVGGPLTDSLRTYAFALPPLDAGTHHLTLRFAPTTTIAASGPPTLAVYRLALEGGGEDMRLAATTLEGRHCVLCSAAPPSPFSPGGLVEPAGATGSTSTLDRGRPDAACRRPGRLARIVKHVRPIRST